MKTLIIKTFLFAILLAGFAACKKGGYPDQLDFVVIDSFTREPIPNAKVHLYKVWQHPTKMANNAKDGAWFPDYGRKHMEEMQTGTTDENGKVSLTQDHKKYLYILPGSSAVGYQMPRLDTLRKIEKRKADGSVYTIVMQPLIKSTFIFKSHFTGLDNDSIVFSSCDKVKVMRGASIDDRLVVYSTNGTENYVKLWYSGTIYRGGKKVTLCNYVIAHPNAKNEFSIDIDI